MMESNPQIDLRQTQPSDLEYFFKFQLNEEGRYLAAFMPENSDDKQVYLKKHLRFLNDPSVCNQTILLGKKIVGSIAKFTIDGQDEVTYWLDRNYWGQGIGSAALARFLTLEKTRPLFARVAFDNIGSQRILERNGFEKIGSDTGFASARNRVIEEFIYRLDLSLT